MNSTCELGDDAARALKPYPAYKDSGVPWLREVPKHWQVRRLKTLCSRSALYGANVAATSYATGGVRFLRTTDITEDGQLNGRGVFLPQESVDNYLLADGDVLISRSGTIGRSFLYERRIHGPCAYAGYLVRFVPAPIALPKYIFLFTKTHAFAGFLRVKAISSTIENVNGEKYANCPLPLPPHSEQAAIVRFLDHADRRIRRHIRAQQQLIALLEEQKQAIIHQAVTGQIDVRTGRPFPAYKPSGVEWLGDVPEHWAVRRARYVFREINERSQEGAEQHLSMSQRLGLVPSHLVENRTLVSESYAGGKLCRTGDLVLNRLKAHLGVFARAQQSGVISADYTVLRPNRGAEAEYFEELLRSPSCRGELRIRAKGIVEGFWRLYTDDLYDIYLPLPPEEEQRSIIRWIESVGARIERSSASGNREIVLLYEYRARLIADVVTGKLDVREAAAGLPNVDPLAAEEDPDDGANLEARLDGDEVGVTVHEAEA